MLRLGITGFFDQGRDASLPEIPAARFKKACYAAVREVRASLESFTPSGVTPNFHRALLELEGARVVVACNAVHPVVGFARPSPEGEPLEFLDHAALAAAFEKSGFEVASAAELARPLTESDLGLLADAERREIAYWKPGTVGDVVFNWFD